MNIKVYEDRKLFNETTNFGNENENLATTLIFEFPEYVEKEGEKFETKDLNKTIIFDIEGDNELPIIGDKFSFPYEITKLGEVVWNVCLKEKSETEDMTDKLIWYSETMISRFGKTNEGHNEITTEKLDAFNVITTTLNEKIAEVEALKVDIGGYKEALDNKVDKKEGYDLSQNDFTNILKEKLDTLDVDLQNGSLKEVNYTASNGMLTFTKNDGSTVSVDLPLELLVESGRYDETNKQIVLTLANGNVINIPISDLLDDFYGKGETYNKTEIDNIIAEKQALIEKLESENKSQQEEIDMLTADYKEGKAEGETAVVSDGLPKSKISVKGNGNSYQETTEGYNLLKLVPQAKLVKGYSTSCDFVDTTNVVINSYNDNNVNFSNTTNGYYGFISEPITLKSGETLKVTGVSSLTTGLRTRILELNEENLYNYLTWNNTTSSNIDTSYTTTEDKTVFVGFWIPNDAIYTVDLTNLMATTKENAIFEPYTGGQASPNTDYPQDIEVIDNAYNLCDTTEFTTLETAGGITFTNVGKGGIRVKGTAKNLVVGRISKPISITKSTRYYIGGGISEEVGVDIRDAFGGAYGQRSTTPNVNTQTISSADVEEAYVSIRVASGVTIDTIIYPFLSLENKPYLPYGHIGLVQRGKNYFDKSKMVKITGVNVEDLDNNVIRVTTNEVTNYNWVKYLLGDVSKYVGKKIYVTGNLKASSTNKARILIAQCDKDGNALSGSSVYFDTSGVAKSIEIVKNETYHYLQLTLYGNTTGTGFNAGAYSEYSNVIVTDLEDTTFEPYIEPIVHSIDLAGEKLAKVGEIADSLNIGVDGSVKIGDKVIKEYVFTGDETISKIGHRFALSLLKGLIVGSASPDDISPILSNMLIARSPNETYLKNDGISVDADGTVRIYIAEKEEVTADEFKTFLKELYNNGTPLKIMYATTDKQTIDLPSIEPITLFEGTNVFELVTNLGTTLAVTYKVSNKSRLEALENAILSLGGNV